MTTMLSREAVCFLAAEGQKHNSTMSGPDVAGSRGCWTIVRASTGAEFIGKLSEKWQQACKWQTGTGWGEISVDRHSDPVEDVLVSLTTCS